MHKNYLKILTLHVFKLSIIIRSNKIISLALQNHASENNGILDVVN